MPLPWRRTSMNDTLQRHTSSALAALLIALFLIFAATPHANACSCVAPDPARDLGASAAAFVGKLVDMAPTGESEFGQANALTFAVVEWVKADLGELVTIVTAENAAACGIVGKPGDIIGIMAYVDSSGRLASNMCQAVDAETLASAIFEGEPSSSIPAVTIEELDGTFVDLNGDLAPLFAEPGDERFPDALPNQLGDDGTRTQTPSGAMSPLFLIGALVAMGASALYVLDRRNARRNTKNIW